MSPLHDVSPGGDVGAFVLKNAAMAIPNNAFTAVTFDTVVYDTGGFYSGGNPSRLTARTAGRFDMSAQAELSMSGGTVYDAGIRINGSNYPGLHGGHRANASGVYFMAHAMGIPLNAGDYIEFYVFQDSGGSVNLGSGATASAWTGGPYLIIKRVF